MIFYYDSITTRVAFYTDIYQEYENFLFLEYAPTEEEWELIKQNYDLFVRDGILVFEKPERIKVEEKKQEEEQKQLSLLDQKAILQSKLSEGTLTLQDLAEFILLL